MVRLDSPYSTRSRSSILSDIIKEYNSKEKVSQCRINPDEIAGIKFLAQREEATIREVKLAWARDRVSMSAIPMNLLASPFLSEGRELPVTMKDNPRWHTILQPSEVCH